MSLSRREFLKSAGMATATLVSNDVEAKTNKPVFGDLTNLNSLTSKLMAANPMQVLRPAMGSEPRVFFIVLDQGACLSAKNQHSLIAVHR